jgi:hypothetical protein
MLKVLKEQIIKEMRENNKDIAIMVPKAVSGYVRAKYKCSAYQARQISKELTNDRKTTD